MSESVMLAAQQARSRQLVWPREHGAWGILLVPLITGAWIGIRTGGSAIEVLLFTLATIALFCLRTPVESLLRTSPIRAANPIERSMVLRFACVFAALLGVSAVLLFWGGRNLGLLVLGAMAGALFAAQLGVKRLGRRGRMPAQVIGALALTSTAPGAYYVAIGKLDACALGLWFANWIFAGNQIHFVQLRLHASRCCTWQEKLTRGSGFFFGQWVMTLALAFALGLGLVSPLVLLAFLPVLIRGLVWFFSPTKPLSLHRLGMAELAHAVVFGSLLVVAIR